MRKTLQEKRIVFEKIAAEVMRMLGVFDRLSKLGETKRLEIVEAEQVVSCNYNLQYLVNNETKVFWKFKKSCETQGNY